MGKKIQVILLLALVVLLTLAAPGWQPAKAQMDLAFPIKIMPFGDSITTSKDPFSSYRCELDHSLNAAGIPFVYVGTQTTNWSGDNPLCGDPLSDYDHHNEGHSGAMAWDFLHLDNWSGTPKYTLDYILSQNVPDMVLMHLGTNDLGQNHAYSQIISDLGLLIDKFRAKNPNMIILIAQIIPCDPVKIGSWCFNVDDVNALIPGLAAQKNTVVSPVVVVDQFDGFSRTADTVDGIHANTSGDTKMAAKWFEKIQIWWNYSPKYFFIPVVVKQ